MPAAKRRTSGGPTASSKAKSRSQSTLAFHGKSNKITKPGSGIASGKLKQDSPALGPADAIEIPTEAEPDVKKSTTTEVSIAKQAKTEAEAPLTPEEVEASKVKEAQIKKYWQEKESLRKAPRVHQDGLSLHEKICREFDTDGRYGPCVGIARIKRWKRAHKLGLKPPIEVLAVLLQEQEEENVKAQHSHVDELMSSRFAEV
ncbi:uncharacterized protein PV09_06754 [Verruconis gallopava]|uniref:DNA polymerase delta subunit 4 n=1 Tax=Verruconis gallopava TaxID=253628 RepID=A0A0D2A588_9PEZI|nr:uncharacterized protein PV09_06754 [Verruconis gallopava]KIW01913.1 hypothetical protein PV09_06754 [Verruconis gallopava]